MKRLFTIYFAANLLGCATLTEDAMTPISMSFSDGSNGSCHLSNKRGSWDTPIPDTVSVRKSDDSLKYICETQDGRNARGDIPSEMGGKIIASAVFIDFGITDAITDKHRKYPVSFVIPLAQVTDRKIEPSENPVQQCIDACINATSKTPDQCFEACTD